MKTRTFDPFVAVQVTGGCTFEPAIGWWTQCESEAQAETFGKSFEGKRDAIYIPTLQKSGDPVDRDLVESLKSEAQALGLTDMTRASGMWVLSTTGEVQSETIWIFSSSESIDRIELEKFATKIVYAANQDCVAREEDGVLKFIDNETSEAVA